MLSSIQATDDVSSVTRHLPSAPATLAQIGTLLHAGDIDLDDLTALLAPEPFLSRGLIDCSNRGELAGAARFETLGSAVARLGLQQTFEVAGALAAHELYADPLPLYGATAAQLRSNALCTALVNEQLARFVGADPYAAYLAGLFRSTGKVVLNGVAARTAAITPYTDGTEPLTAWEAENVGYVNADLVTEAFAAWGFPPQVLEAVREHYEPAPNAAVETHLLGIAAHSAQASFQGLPGEVWYWQITRAKLAATHLTDTQILEAISHAQRSFEVLTAALPR